MPRGPRDLPARQRTLEATLDWSLGLLDAPSRDLVDDLTIFESPFGLDAIEIVGDVEIESIDRIAALVDGSLLSVEGDRYRMLPSIRDVIRARMDADRAARLGDRHAAWIVSASRIAYDHMHGGGDEVPTRRRMASVLPDIRTALAHLVAADRHEDAARVLILTTLVWFHEGLLGEFLQRLAATADGSRSDRTRAEVAVMRGVIGWMSGEADRSLGFLREGIEVLRSQTPASVVLVNGLCHLAAASAEQGHRDEAFDLADEAVEVARGVDDPGSLPLAWEFAGYVAHLLGDGDRAVAASQAAVDATRILDLPQLCTSLAALSAALADVGRNDEAIQAGWEAIEVADRLGSTQQVAETVVTVAPVLGVADPSVIAERIARRSRATSPSARSHQRWMPAYTSRGSLPSRTLWKLRGSSVLWRRAAVIVSRRTSAALATCCASNSARRRSHMSAPSGVLSATTASHGWRAISQRTFARQRSPDSRPPRPQRRLSENSAPPTTFASATDNRSQKSKEVDEMAEMQVQSESQEFGRLGSASSGTGVRPWLPAGDAPGVRPWLAAGDAPGLRSVGSADPGPGVRQDLAAGASAI